MERQESARTDSKAEDEARTTVCPNKCLNNPAYAESYCRLCAECYNECMLTHQPRLASRSLTLVPQEVTSSPLARFPVAWDLPPLFHQPHHPALEIVGRTIAPNSRQPSLLTDHSPSASTQQIPATTQQNSATTHQISAITHQISAITHQISAITQPISASTQQIPTSPSPHDSMATHQTELPPRPSCVRQACHACNRRLNLTDQTCKCGHRFCSSHRLAEQHCCTYDYKAEGRLRLAEENPPVRPAKLMRNW